MAADLCAVGGSSGTKPEGVTMRGTELISMRRRPLAVRLVSVLLVLSATTIGMATTAGPAAAAATPVCTWNGGFLQIVPGVTAGETIKISCTGLPALRPYLLLQASLLIGIDPTAASLLSGGSTLSTSTFEAALAALPEIDAASLTVIASDLSGDLTYSYTVPSIQATDPNATCPPNEQQFNSGLLGLRPGHGRPHHPDAAGRR